MKIGIDASCWANKRGYGRFTREMLTALFEQDKENEYVLFMDSATACQSNLPSHVECIAIDLSQSPTQAASASGRRSITDMLKMGREVAKVNLTLFFYPSVYTYFPIFNRIKKIVAIHDVIAEKFPQLVFTNRINRTFWNIKVWFAIKQANLIMTVSEFSKQGIMEYFGMSGDTIGVVSEAADKSFRPIHESYLLTDILARFNLDITSKFILYVGGIAPHKNLSTLVKAYSKLINNTVHKDIKLVLVGDYEKDVFLIDKDLDVLLKQLHLADRIIFTGFVSDEELVYFYNAATVFVLPSFIEGFGLPAIESMACGTPVIGSKTTSLPEVVGSAGLFFDPNSPDELLDHLVTVIEDEELRKDLTKRSLHRSAEFSWSKSALETLRVFNQLGKNEQVT
ncbi:MAG: glycosyltransferase family 4 protein [Candidatus Scalindua sp.]|nr:glycosyltransferase family 4 protein [Candidatus Scalindua sp.]